MPRVAFATFAIMKAPYGHDIVRGFEQLTPLVFREAENSDGFIARAKEMDERHHLTNFDRDWGCWGRFAVPRFYDGGRTTAGDTRASTLSLWRDIPSVHSFVYRSLHRTALAQRHEWFRKPKWPTYAMWWVGDHDIPTWEEAAERLEFLHDNGPSSTAFDFHQPFDAESHETTLGELFRLQQGAAD